MKFRNLFFTFALMVGIVFCLKFKIEVESIPKPAGIIQMPFQGEDLSYDRTTLKVFKFFVDHCFKAPLNFFAQAIKGDFDRLASISFFSGDWFEVAHSFFILFIYLFALALIFLLLFCFAKILNWQKFFIELNRILVFTLALSLVHFFSGYLQVYQALLAYAVISFLAYIHYYLSMKADTVVWVVNCEKPTENWVTDIFGVISGKILFKRLVMVVALGWSIFLFGRTLLVANKTTVKKVLIKSLI